MPAKRAWRRGAAGALATALLGLGLGAGGSQAAAAVACTAGTPSDFNGDGVRDTAVADPDATVSGKERAGLVHIVLGGGKGVVEISQDTTNVGDAPEAGDRFGFSLAVYDADKDGCSDLAVGIPYEDVGTVKDAGYVQVIFGSTSAVGSELPSKDFVQGATQPLVDAPEADDWFGYALGAGTSTTGHPYLAIGIPGEDGTPGVDMGMLGYVYGTAYNAVNVTQDKVGMWEDAEPYDRFGASIAGTDRFFAVGVPGESTGTTAFAGGVHVFRPSINTDGIPDQFFGLRQDVTVSGDPGEADDQYGAALALAPYRPSGAATFTDAILAVGVPGEDVENVADAGAVHVYHVKADGTVVQLNRIDQNVEGVDGDAEPGDYFGQRLAAANTATNVVSTATTMRLAVGVPGEESSADAPEAGGVQLFSLLGAPGAADSWIEPGNGIPSGPAARTYAGISLGASPSLLYVGLPYGPAAGRAVHGFPWNAATGSAPTQTWKPGEGGIPAAGAAAFGATVR
ncbi:VCBS repeat-containing protein [Streptomyces sp. NBC_01275]|uniref:VCBS repeat-containing protein n=1 Tax=Streptomyces sp. NBC_01275 TaxID=2903807 RepID=UPI002250ADFA|nr:VCBS repeat-containing protein [Streptomyces sp. NBC_01275]MCX4762130.1 VCBS repeat-containing protein [Streptomyces sp. NBC_01275]